MYGGWLCLAMITGACWHVALISDVPVVTHVTALRRDALWFVGRSPLSLYNTVRKTAFATSNMKMNIVHYCNC